MSKIDLSLVLPIHNQAAIITPVVKEICNVLKKEKINSEIILVENGSKDNTLQILKKLSKKYTNATTIVAKKGYGSAVLEGLKVAKGKYVSYMPSDGQLDPNLVPLLYKIIIKENYDLVKIKRVTRESTIRYLRSKVFNLLTRLLFKITAEDINGSPRIFERKWLSVLDLQFKDSFIDAEMAVKAYCLKWKIKEISAKTLPRLGGKSTVNFKTVLEFLSNLFHYKFGKDLKRWKIKKKNI